VARGSAFTNEYFFNCMVYTTVAGLCFIGAGTFVVSIPAFLREIFVPDTAGPVLLSRRQHMFKKLLENQLIKTWLTVRSIRFSRRGIALERLSLMGGTFLCGTSSAFWCLFHRKSVNTKSNYLITNRD